MTGSLCQKKAMDLSVTYQILLKESFSSNSKLFTKQEWTTTKKNVLKADEYSCPQNTSISKLNLCLATNVYNLNIHCDMPSNWKFYSKSKLDKNLHY